MSYITHLCRSKNVKTSSVSQSFLSVMSNHESQHLEDEDGMLDADEAAEEVPLDADVPMDSDPEGDEETQEILLQNDSIAHMDLHTDSIYCITAHPLEPSIVATGSGDDTAYVFSTSIPSPLLPPSYESNPDPTRRSLQPIVKLGGHTDSINAIAFTLPHGDFLCTAGLDGRLRAHTTPPLNDLNQEQYNFLAQVQEVEEINWLSPCPHPSHPNTIALGASDGSVWVYTIDGSDRGNPLQLLQTYFLHTASCTAGSWGPDGKLLATVSEDSSLYVWDVFGEATAANQTAQGSGQAVVGLSAADQRFAVEGGLYSVAIAPTGAFVAVGGAEGNIRAISLPRVAAGSSGNGNTNKSQKAGPKGKAGGGKQSNASESTGQAGQILASLKAQSDGIETLAFSAPPLTLLAAGSVDGSIILLDAAHRFAVRRHIQEAHEDQAVVKVEFVSPSLTSTNPGGAGAGGWLLTSCGMDGAVRRWDARGGTAASGQGLIREWKGHRGGGEGGGVMGFVQFEGEAGGRIVTAGDDGISLVFEAGRI
jgi:ribosome assembly protein SQT1